MVGSGSPHRPSTARRISCSPPLKRMRQCGSRSPTCKAAEPTATAGSAEGAAAAMPDTDSPPAGDARAPALALLDGHAVVARVAVVRVVPPARPDPGLGGRRRDLAVERRAVQPLSLRLPKTQREWLHVLFREQLRHVAEFLRESGRRLDVLVHLAAVAFAHAICQLADAEQSQGGGGRTSARCRRDGPRT